MIKLIPLGQNKAAMVDADDYEWLKEYRWTLFDNAGARYASRRERKGSKYYKTVLMHRDIMLRCDPRPNSAELVVDHKDHNTLNNTKANLQWATRSENNAHRRRFDAEGNEIKGGRGVYKLGSKWKAEIRVNKEITYLGMYDTEAEAEAAYDRAAYAAWGDFAMLNGSASVALEDIAPPKPLTGGLNEKGKKVTWNETLTPGRAERAIKKSRKP